MRSNVITTRPSWFKPRVATAADGRATEHDSGAHTDWLFHRLRIEGAAEQLDALCKAASGAGIICGWTSNPSSVASTFLGGLELARDGAIALRHEREWRDVLIFSSP